MSRKKLRKRENISDTISADSSKTAKPVSEARRLERADSPGHKFRWQPFMILGGIILAVVAICFGNTLAMGTAFHDRTTFAQLKFSNNDAYFTQLWARSLAQPLSQPWLRASFAKDIVSYSTNFGWYHLVNVFLHLSACIALFCLVLRLAWRMRNEQRASSDPWKLASVAALIYACHPLAVQSATYITGRYMPLAAVNILIACNCLLVGLFGRSTSAKGWGYGLTALFAFMALNSNEVGVITPLILLALFFLAKKPVINWDDWVLDNHPILFGLLAILSIALPFVYFLGFSPGYAADFYGLPMLSTAGYTATQAKAFLTYYGRCFFVPFGLSLDPPFSIATSWADPLALLGAAAGIGVVYLLVRYWRTYPLLALGLLLVLAGFIPHACIVQTESVADPVFYLSLAGMSLVAGWVFCEIVGEKDPKFITKFAPLVVLLVVLSVLRNLDWSSDDKLLAATLRTNQTSAPALAWSAENALTKKDPNKAISLADQALSYDSNLVIAYMAKAHALSNLKKYDEADNILRKADELATKQHLSIGQDLKLDLAENDLHTGKPLEAQQLIFNSSSLDPNNPRILYIVGLAAFQMSKYEPGYMYLRRAVQYGIVDALAPLAECSIRMHNYDEALGLAQNAVKYLPGPEAQFALGSALYAKNQLDAAETAFKSVVKEQPKNALALAFLATVYDRKGEKALADSYRIDALKLDPASFSKIPLPSAAAAGPSDGSGTAGAAPASNGAAAGSTASSHAAADGSRNQGGSRHHTRRHH